MVKVSSDKIKGFLVQTQDTILSAAFTVSILYFVSALLGLVKSRVLVSFFGASTDLSTFFIADRIPSAIYTTIFLGSLSTVFIPVFLKINKEDKDKSYEYASNLFNLVLVFFIFLSLIIFIFSKEILYLLTVGKLSLAEIDTASNLLNIMLLGQLILIFSSFLTSILNAKRNFLIPAFSPIIFNIIFIISIPLLYPFYGIYSAAWGMVLGSVFHLLIQVPSFLAYKFSWKLILNLKDKDIKHSFNLSISSFVATVLNQVILIVENSLALLISSASVIYLKFSDQLRYFPVHLFGASIAVAALPILSSEYEDDLEKFKKTVKTSLLQIIYLSVPVTVLLIILKIPLVRIVYGADKFTWDDTVMTAFCLSIFSLSIFSQSCNIFLSKCFYAFKNTTVPLIGSLLTLIVTVTFPLYFISKGYEVWVVILGFVIATYVNLAYFLLKFKRILDYFSLREIAKPMVKIAFSGFIMSLFLYFPMQYLDNYVFNTTYVVNLLALTGIVSFLGIGIYFAITYWFRVPEVQLMFKILKKFKIKNDRLENLENQLNQSIS